MKTVTYHHGRRILAAAAALGLQQGAGAAGFALIEQGVAGMGTAYAGAAATADTVDTLFFNPAGMTRLPGNRTGAAVHLVLPQNEFRNEGTMFSPLVGGGAIPGSNGGDAGGLEAVPHAYLTHQLNDQTWLGLAINVPFGLTTEYDSDWVGRYHAIKSAVKTLNINPSIAYRVNEQLSVAAGVSAMYLDGEFTNAVDFGTLNQLPVRLGGLEGALGAALPGQADGKAVIEGDSWGWGFNVGLLYEVSEATRLGLHYRSEIEQNIEGDVTFTLPTPALAGTFSDAAVKSTVDLPASFSASLFHQLNPQWAVMADYTWTGWSSIPELRFDFANALPDGVTTFDWKDTSRISVGTTYAPSGQDWTYRFGVAYDESPIRDAASRSARLPDSDRIWLAVGAGFKASERLSIDIGYAHLFIDDPKIRKTGLEPEDVSRGALVGSYDSSVDILSVEARYVF
jgi:long-chain fatty acid transport protein